nr:C-type lectin domain family 2 member D-like isoform X1 [Chrysemys picta bellii]
MENGSCPAEKSEPDPLLASQETHVQQNGITPVTISPKDGKGRKIDPTGGNTAVSLLIVQKMAEESAEVTSDTSRGVNDSMLPGHGQVEERRRDVDFSLKCIKDKRIPITVTVVITALIITVIALAAKKMPPCPRCPPHVTAACPDGWVGYQGKCYYFSETEGNWNNSQSHCSSLNASLASIDSLPELNFMLRYRGILYHWIGLHREQGEGQPWKWTNGTIFNNLFQVRGEGQCAYLDEHGVSSSRCYSEKHFICRRPAECSRRKPSGAGGDTRAKIM